MDSKKSIEDTVRAMLGDAPVKVDAEPAKQKKKRSKMTVTFKGPVKQVINGDVYGNTLVSGQESDDS